MTQKSGLVLSKNTVIIELVWQILVDSLQDDHNTENHHATLEPDVCACSSNDVLELNFSRACFSCLSI